MTCFPAMRPATLLGLALVLASAPHISMAQELSLAQELVPVLTPFAALEVNGHLEGKKGKVAKDISGMACAPASGARRLCLLVNDENKDAQFVNLSGQVIEAGKLVALTGMRPAADALGAPPAVTCGKAGKFAEFDGEGVAYEGAAFYVIGSHGCSRNSNQFRVSSFYLARIAMTGEAAEPSELTYRFSDVLMAAAKIAPYFGKPLGANSNGLNIEGLAVTGGMVWAGLRAPVADGNAYLVGASIASLFAPGEARWQGTPDMRALALGEGRGIRDLAALPDGRLLILSGPAQDQDVDYRIHITNPGTSAPPRLLGAIKGGGTKGKNKSNIGKAEVITLLQVSKESVEFAILYDSIKNGGGQIYRVPLN